MPNYKLRHVEYGELDIRLPDLGRPDLPWLWELLEADERRPISRRQLLCGGICWELGHREWMHVYERQGRRVAAHQSRAGEKRHEARMSDEHKAYQERTVLAAEAGGLRAETEVRTPDGKVRTDVLIHGAAEQPIGIEIQRSRISDKTVRARTKNASDRGILAAWHTDRRDLFERNEVAWTRTDQGLPIEAIRNDAHLRIRGGVRRLDMVRCDARQARPCPVKRTGHCGGWHPVSSPVELPYDDFVRMTATGELVQASVKERRQTFRFWTRADQRDRYVASLSDEPAVRPAPRSPATAPSPGAPTCRPRPAKVSSVEAPVRPRATPGQCSAGVVPCGAPARLFAAGWRCVRHSPAAVAGRPEAPGAGAW